MMKGLYTDMIKDAKVTMPKEMREGYVELATAEEPVELTSPSSLDEVFSDILDEFFSYDLKKLIRVMREEDWKINRFPNGARFSRTPKEIALPATALLVRRNGSYSAGFKIRTYSDEIIVSGSKSDVSEKKGATYLAQMMFLIVPAYQEGLTDIPEILQVHEKYSLDRRK